MILPNGADAGSGSNNAVWSFYADATNVYVRVPAGAVFVGNKTTGNYSTATLGNWRLKLYAYA